MLKRKDIKNGTFVYDSNEKSYGIIQDVGNAREKGDRGESTTPLDELSYSVADILTGETYDGICEHSGMTSTFLSIATEMDINIYLMNLEADAMIILAQAKKEFATISDAMNNFSKLI